MNKKNDILMKHNTLVNAQYSITLNSNRLFTYLLYKFQKGNYGELSCVINRKELSDLLNRRSDGTVQGLSKHLNTLRKKDLNLFDLNEDGTYEYLEYGFINGFIYNSSNDTFTITANERVYNLLHKYLDEGYTPINLEIWLSLQNTYAQRLYDLLRAWSGTKNTINYSVNKLRELMLLESKYKQYTDFRKRVLIPAIDELNNTGYFQIDYSEVKKGRSIDSIDFIVKDLDKRKYFANDVSNIKEPSQLEEMESSKPSLEYALTMDTKYIDNVEGKINKIIDLKPSICELYIPDETVFTKGTLRSFKKDFKSIDFKNEYMERAFDDALSITMERDDVETIKVSSYKFFKGCLDNKIVEYKIEEQEDLNHKKEMDIHW
ncbi:MAG: replication initiation protein [Romboutsia sp.]